MRMGTSVYWAHEVIGGACFDFGPLTDSFALGISVFFMLVGGSEEDLYDSVKLSEQIQLRKIRWRCISQRSPEEIDFIKRLTERNVSLRMSCTEALQHPWITANTLNFVPEKFMVADAPQDVSTPVNTILVNPTIEINPQLTFQGVKRTHSGNSALGSIGSRPNKRTR